MTGFKQERRCSTANDADLVLRTVRDGVRFLDFERCRARNERRQRPVWRRLRVLGLEELRAATRRGAATVSSHGFLASILAKVSGEPVLHIVTHDLFDEGLIISTRLTTHTQEADFFEALEWLSQCLDSDEPDLMEDWIQKSDVQRLLQDHYKMVGYSRTEEASLKRTLATLPLRCFGGRRLLDHCCEHGLCAVVSLLLRDYAPPVAKEPWMELCNPTLRDRRFGNTAFHICAYAGHVACLRHLLDYAATHGINVTALRDNEGRSPLQLAEDQGHGLCAAMLRPHFGLHQMVFSSSSTTMRCQTEQVLLLDYLDGDRRRVETRDCYRSGELLALVLSVGEMEKLRKVFLKGCHLAEDTDGSNGSFQQLFAALMDCTSISLFKCTCSGGALVQILRAVRLTLEGAHRRPAWQRLFVVPATVARVAEDAKRQICKEVQKLVRMPERLLLLQCLCRHSTLNGIPTGLLPAGKAHWCYILAESHRFASFFHMHNKTPQGNAESAAYHFANGPARILREFFSLSRVGNHEGGAGAIREAMLLSVRAYTAGLLHVWAAPFRMSTHGNPRRLLETAFSVQRSQVERLLESLDIGLQLLVQMHDLEPIIPEQVLVALTPPALRNLPRTRQYLQDQHWLSQDTTIPHHLSASNDLCRLDLRCAKTDISSCHDTGDSLDSTIRRLETRELSPGSFSLEAGLNPEEQPQFSGRAACSNAGASTGASANKGGGDKYSDLAHRPKDQLQLEGCYHASSDDAELVEQSELDVVKFAFDATNFGDEYLPLVPGDLVERTGPTDDGWVFGRRRWRCCRDNSGEEMLAEPASVKGWYPRAYTESWSGGSGGSMCGGAARLAVAISTFDGAEFGESYMSLQVGDLVESLGCEEGGWQLGRCISACSHKHVLKEGWYPPGFTQPLQSRHALTNVVAGNLSAPQQNL